MGDGLVLAGFPLLALTLTHDTLLIAGVTVAGWLPALLVSLPAGAVVDRVDRRRLMVGLQVAQAAVLGGFAALVVAGWDSLGLLYAAIFVLGAATRTFQIASQTVLPSIVEPALLPEANGYNLGANMVGEQLAGPGLGGVLASLSLAIPLLGDAASFLVATLFVRRSVPRHALSDGGERLWAGMVAGLRWYLRQPFLRVLTAVVAALAFCQSVVLALLVVFATADLKLGRGGYGAFLAVAAVGQVAGYLAGGRALRRFGPLVCVASAAVVAALAYGALGATTLRAVAAAALVVQGFAEGVGNSTVVSIRNLAVPPEYRGRATSVYNFFVIGFIPLGGLVGGVVGQQLGVRAAFVGAGLLQLAVLAVVAVPLVRCLRSAWAVASPYPDRRRG